jgi:hypothetical protein
LQSLYEKEALNQMSTTLTPSTPPPDTQGTSPLAHLSEPQLEELAREFDAIRDRVMNELGDRDRRYIESMIEMQRRLAVLGRILLLASRNRAGWWAGTASLSAAKILENMEIGHNVMHGQWDWMNDPRIHSSTWDWDTASTAEAWKHSHNYVHHTYTNIRGEDKDLGYEIMRIDPQQRWNAVYLAQPVYNLILAALFEWGVAFHDLDFEAIRKGQKSKSQLKRELRGIAGKAKSQVVKDYIAWPLVSALAAAAVDAGMELRRGKKQPRGIRAVLRRKRVSRWAPMLRSRAAAGPSGQRLRPTPPPTSSATSGPTRSSSAGTSPTRPTPSPRKRSRTRAAAAGTSASSPGPPISRVARCSTSPAATSATRSSTTSSPTCRAAATPRSPPR